MSDNLTEATFDVRDLRNGFAATKTGAWILSAAADKIEEQQRGIERLRLLLQKHAPGVLSSEEIAKLGRSLGKKALRDIT